MIVTPVYSAGEAPIPGIDRDELASGLRRHGHPHVLTVDDEQALVETIASVAKPGDVVVGLGAGTITCNYDGFEKHFTRIGDRVQIGSDTQLVAPVSVGDDAYVAAGTTVTKDVPAGALAVSRVTIKLVEGWVARFRARPRRGR